MKNGLIILLYLISILSCGFLTSCGQSGRLYLPDNTSSQPIHSSGKN